MSRLPVPKAVRPITYPTSDGKPMAETDIHRRLMTELIAALQAFYTDEPLVYVSGNLLLFYEENNRHKHISPDVFVVPGVGNHERDNFLLWEEGRGPRFVIELTSSSTRKEDTHKKKALYQDVLKVREYFLFDPHGDYLKPPMMGFRLVKGIYQTINAVDGRLPSLTTGLHLERAGNELRLWNPETGTWLPTPAEHVNRAEARADRAAERANQAAERADQEAERASRAEAELRQLRERFGLGDEGT